MSANQEPAFLHGTPQDSLSRLRQGNGRFSSNQVQGRDLPGQIAATKDGQRPFAAILSCMDSRVPAEIVFDQGIGDIFSIRLAGNIVTSDVLGSLEYATAVAGANLILVLGHTGCGAVKGACDHVELGHLTGLLASILPAVEQEHTVQDNRTSSNPAFVEKVTNLNVARSVLQIQEESPLIRQQVQDGRLVVAGAVYDIATGRVRFNEPAAV